MTAQRDATMPTPLTVVPRGRAGKAPSPLTHNRPMIRAADVHVVMPQTFPSPIPLKVEAALRFSPDGNRHSQHESTIVPLTTLTMSPTTPTSTPTLKLTHKNNERVNHGNVTDLENGTTVIQDFHLLKIRRLKNFEDCTCPTDSHALLISVFKIWHGRMHVVKEVPNDHMYAKTPLQLLDRICHVFDNAEHFRHAVTLHSHLQSSKLSLIKSRTTKIDMLMASRKFRAGIEYLRQVQCNNVDCECRCEQTVEVKETNNNDQTQQQRKKKEKKRHSNRNKSNSGKSSNDDDDDDADEEGQQQQQQKQQQQQPENLKGGGNQKSGKKRKLEELSVDEPLDAKKQRHFLSLDYESQKHLIKLERLKLQRQQFELEEKKVDVAERKDKRQFEIKKMRLEFEHQRNLKVQENFKELSKIVSRLGCALARQGKNEREVSERHVKEEDESDDNGDDEDDDSDDNDSDDDRDDGKNGGKKDDDGDDDDEGSDDDGDSDDDVQLDDDNESGENGGDGVEEVNGQDDSK